MNLSLILRTPFETAHAAFPSAGAAAGLRPFALVTAVFGLARAAAGALNLLSCSKSPHLFIVILLLSNSPSSSCPPLSPPGFAPAVCRVSPQEKSSKCQKLYVGRMKFQTGREMR